MLHPRDIPKMEAALSARGVSIETLCDSAEIDRTTWWRWREGKVSPRLDAWERAVSIFEKLTSDKHVNPPTNLRVAS